jgi:AraC family transcriptional regulator
MDSQKNQYLYIKNMVSPLCIQTVTEEAIHAGLKIRSVRLGSIVLAKKGTEEQLNLFREGLEKKGFLLVSNKRERMIEAIKTEIINMVYYENKIPGNQNFSSYLSFVLGKDYSFLSALFSSSEKTTIEKYIMFQKAEKTKELLSKGKLSLGEIARKLGYSNTQHLSSQFKKMTGMSPSEYKKNKNSPPLRSDRADIDEEKRSRILPDRDIKT